MGGSTHEREFFLREYMGELRGDARARERSCVSVLGRRPDDELENCERKATLEDVAERRTLLRGARG